MQRTISITIKETFLAQLDPNTAATSVVDPDPNLVRIQNLCGTKTVFRIRIRIQTSTVNRIG